MVAGPPVEDVALNLCACCETLGGSVKTKRRWAAKLVETSASSVITFAGSSARPSPVRPLSSR